MVITSVRQQAAIVCVDPEAKGSAAALGDESPFAGQLIAEDPIYHPRPVEDAAGAAARDLLVSVLDLDDALGA